MPSSRSALLGLALLAMIIPITILANFIRVVALVLIAYYGGVELIDGPLHDLTGIALFVVAVMLVLLTDGIFGLFISLFRGFRGWPIASPGRLSPEAQPS